MDRKYWSKLRFEKDDWRSYPCPTCNHGSLVLERKSLHENLSAPYRAYRAEEGYEPDCCTGTFSCIFICSNPECSETVAVVGTTYERTDYREQKTLDGYDPEFFTPPLHPFRIPEKCPPKVKEAIIASFRIFIVDPSGAMNQVRKSVECLMDRWKSPKYTTVTRGGRQVKEGIKLHHRIDFIRRQRNKPAVADKLEAIKWIGNAGSHDSNVKRDDVLDAYELLEHVLVSEFANRDEELAAMTVKINRRKKPRSHKR